MQFEIKSRWNSETVLFTCELTEEVAAQSYILQLGFAVKAAVQAGANLAGANLAGADLADANLAGADLADANLARANLARADLAGADLAGANLAGADLADANLARADLAGADLADANLADANLAGADLADANLARADLFDEKITKPVTQLLTEIWPVIIGETKIKIGCQLHTIAEWQSFDDDEIAGMANAALDWWRVWKAPIMEICKATGKLSGGDNAVR